MPRCMRCCFFLHFYTLIHADIKLPLIGRRLATIIPLVKCYLLSTIEEKLDIKI